MVTRITNIQNYSISARSPRGGHLEKITSESRRARNMHGGISSNHYREKVRHIDNKWLHSRDKRISSLQREKTVTEFKYYDTLISPLLNEALRPQTKNCKSVFK